MTGPTRVLIPIENGPLDISTEIKWSLVNGRSGVLLITDGKAIGFRSGSADSTAVPPGNDFNPDPGPRGHTHSASSLGHTGDPDLEAFGNETVVGAEPGTHTLVVSSIETLPGRGEYAIIDMPFGADMRWLVLPRWQCNVGHEIYVQQDGGDCDIHAGGKLRKLP